MAWAWRRILKSNPKLKLRRRSLKLLKIEILWHFLSELRKRLKTKRRNIYNKLRTPKNNLNCFKTWKWIWQGSHNSPILTTQRWRNSLSNSRFLCLNKTESASCFSGMSNQLLMNLGFKASTLMKILSTECSKMKEGLADCLQLYMHFISSIFFLSTRLT